MNTRKQDNYRKSSRKEVIALGQTYFAIQTRKQELLEEAKQIIENEKRLKLRKHVKEGNKKLNGTVYKVGARKPEEFSKFHNEGYKGLYN